jgi:hypothetical protein
MGHSSSSKKTPNFTSGSTMHFSATFMDRRGSSNTFSGGRRQVPAESAFCTLDSGASPPREFTVWLMFHTECSHRS